AVGREEACPFLVKLSKRCNIAHPNEAKANNSRLGTMAPKRRVGRHEKFTRRKVLRKNRLRQFSPRLFQGFSPMARCLLYSPTARFGCESQVLRPKNLHPSNLPSHTGTGYG